MESPDYLKWFHYNIFILKVIKIISIFSLKAEYKLLSFFSHRINFVIIIIRHVSTLFLQWIRDVFFDSFFARNSWIFWHFIPDIISQIHSNAFLIMVFDLDYWTPFNRIAQNIQWAFNCDDFRYIVFHCRTPCTHSNVSFCYSRTFNNEQSIRLIT